MLRTRRGSGEVQFALHAGATAVLIGAEPSAREGCHVMRAPPGIGRPVRGMGLVGIKCVPLLLPASTCSDVLQMGCVEMQHIRQADTEPPRMLSCALYACTLQSLT